MTRNHRFPAIAALILLTAALYTGCSRTGPAEVPTFTAPTVPTAPSSPSHVSSGLDKTPPLIVGTLDRTVEAGEAVAWLSGILVSDETDPHPSLEADTSHVDLSTPGLYFMTYIARDASGNETRMAASVTVVAPEVQPTVPQTLYAQADRVLEAIVTDGMSREEQVWAIYRWARKNIDYVNHGDHTDWMSAAEAALEEGEGDCFRFFSVTKLLFQRLGIPNIDVQKVRNDPDDSDHFWSLVSIDGGETYYHFDATPRKNQTLDLCLLTDQALDDYSDAHSRCHNRDTSLYPTTPKT